jgi:hypothetical protein
MDDYEIVRDLFDRIPSLAVLRGVERIKAEEAIRFAWADALDRYIEECETVACTGGAP